MGMSRLCGVGFAGWDCVVWAALYGLVVFGWSG